MFVLLLSFRHGVHALWFLCGFLLVISAYIHLHTRIIYRTGCSIYLPAHLVECIGVLHMVMSQRIWQDISKITADFVRQFLSKENLIEPRESAV